MELLAFPCLCETATALLCHRIDKLLPPPIWLFALLDVMFSCRDSRTTGLTRKNTLRGYKTIAHRFLHQNPANVISLLKSLILESTSW